MGRHAGQTGEIRSQSPDSHGRGGGTAVLTNPQGVFAVDAPPTGGLGLSSAFGRPSARRVPADLPAIGTPEHTALLSGGLDLDAIAAAQDRRPLVGFAPIVLDPAGPSRDDLVDGGQPGSGACSAGLPSRRTVRGGARPPVRNGRGGVPGQRPSAGGPVRGRLRPAPPVVTGPPTNALGIDEMLASLAALPVMEPAEDVAATGELARPFVDESCLTDWSGEIDEVLPPISVDMFQKAVRAGVAPEEAAAAVAAGTDIDEIVARVVAEREAAAREADALDVTPKRRTRREQRARERALNSVRGVAARRLAKGGVLAITALGVVSGATPYTFGFGTDTTDDLTTTAGALDFAGALAPKINMPPLSPEGKAQRAAQQQDRSLRQERSDEAADQALSAGIGTGSALLDLAFQQDQDMEARHQAELAAAARAANSDPKRFARILVAERGWSSGQFQCLDLLWTRESQWNYRAVNASSGAYGIAQALPGSKMNSVGSDWRTNSITQIKWGLNYIQDRYGTPCGAWGHSQSTGWY